MRIALGIALFFLSAFTNARRDVHSGQLHRYVYRGRLLSGIPTLTPQFSGLEILSDLLIQPHRSTLSSGQGDYLVKLENIQVAKLLHKIIPDPYTADIPKDFSHSSYYEKVLGKAIPVTFRDGLVASFQVHPTEPTWSLNIKKGILSLLQLNYGKIATKEVNYQNDRTRFHPKVFSVYEDGIGGLCETQYTVDSIHSPDVPVYDNVLNITKLKNYNNCVKRSVFGHDNHAIRGCPWHCSHEKLSETEPEDVEKKRSCGCPTGYETNDDIVKSFVSTKYNIRGTINNPVLESVLSEGKSVISIEGSDVVVLAHQNLTLRSVEPVREISTEQNRLIKYTSLVYELPDSRVPQSDIYKPTSSYRPTETVRYSRNYLRPRQLNNRIPSFFQHPDIQYQEFVKSEEKQFTEEPYSQQYPSSEDTLDIPYLSVATHIDRRVMRNTARDILESLTVDVLRGDLSVSDVISFKVLNLVNALSVLKVDDLRALLQKVLPVERKYGTAEREQVRGVRELYVVNNITFFTSKIFCYPGLHLLVTLDKSKLNYV
ncbi:vitellogenin-like [Tachypleus tridentatus]|uniref:vitellogenin-like n=1 Tax=Tachypleus tridentatus TaxID=6853 RepID=UPI003FD27F53